MICDPTTAAYFSGWPNDIPPIARWFWPIPLNGSVGKIGPGLLSLEKMVVQNHSTPASNDLIQKQWRTSKICGSIEPLMSHFALPYPKLAVRHQRGDVHFLLGSSRRSFWGTWASHAVRLDARQGGDTLCCTRKGVLFFGYLGLFDVTMVFRCSQYAYFMGQNYILVFSSFRLPLNIFWTVKSYKHGPCSNKIKQLDGEHWHPWPFRTSRTEAAQRWVSTAAGPHFACFSNFSMLMM